MYVSMYVWMDGWMDGFIIKSLKQSYGVTDAERIFSVSCSWPWLWVMYLA